MNWLRLIYFVEHRGERRCFAAPGGARDKDDPSSFLDDFVKDPWQSEHLKGWDFGLQLSHHDRLLAALFENIHAKPGKIFERVTAVA
jgi:hypothetical protein